MKQAIIAGAIVGAMSAAPAFAQSSNAPSGTPSTGRVTRPGGATSGSTAGMQNSKGGTVAAADQSFVKKAAVGGMAEVELGNLAKDKASSEQVKQFAQRMVDDHSKVNDQLKSLAQSKSITLPTELDAQHKAVRDRLSKLSGDQFDRAYMQAMVKDHREDVNEFRKESKSAKDQDVKAFAASTLPTLEDHLKLAQQDAGAVGTSGSKSKEPAGMNKTGSDATGTKGSGKTTDR